MQWGPVQAVEAEDYARITLDAAQKAVLEGILQEIGDNGNRSVITPRNYVYYNLKWSNL